MSMVAWYATLASLVVISESITTVKGEGASRPAAVAFSLAVVAVLWAIALALAWLTGGIT